MKLSIQVKLILTVLVGMLVWGWLHYYIQQRAILPSYQQQERRIIREQALHIRALLEYKLKELDRFCYDWAAWDDTYEFIQTRDPAYIESNLPFTTFRNNNLNLIHYMNNAGEKVWHKFYNLKTGKPYEEDDFWSRPQWDLDEEPFLQIEGVEDSATGLIKLKQGVMLIAARPILRSSAAGDIRGRLIMGRMLEGEVTSYIKEHMRKNVEFVPWNVAEARHSAEDMALLRSGKVFCGPTGDNNEYMCGHVALFDLWGKPVTVARLRTERTLMKQGEKALLRNVQGNLIAGTIVLLFMLAVMHRYVILPLRRLTSSVQNIRHKPEWAELPQGLKGADEIGILAREFDGMLERISAQIEFKDSIAEKLERSRARTRLMLDTTPDVILTASADGTIKTCNRAIESLLGYDCSMVPGMKIFALMAPPYRERMKHHLAVGDTVTCHCFTAGCEANALKSDGSEVPVHMRGCPMDKTPEPMLLWTMRDISELKAMHEKVAHHERLAAIGQMAASVAHDVRNPLTGISGGVQLLLKQNELTASQKMVLEEMLALADRIEHTVTQMLAFSKRWEPTIHKINLVQFLENIGAELSEHPGFEDIDFAFSGEKRLFIMADPELMRQVFNNLYQNAQEAMDNGGKIGTVVTRYAGMAKVLIKDRGAGMQEDVVGRVLEPFYSTKNEGTGLGLSICQKIVEAHDGQIRFDSKPGEGTTVTVTLPLGNQELLGHNNNGAQYRTNAG
jgi:PAS domain S-box-containing protein